MKHDWEQLKKEYLNTENLSLSALAKKHGISYQSVKKESAKEGWFRQKKKMFPLPSTEHENTHITNSSVQSCDKAICQLSQTEKINRIAEQLLNNIEQGTEMLEKPTHIATLTGALKELTAILRDVNELPTQKQRWDYELSKQKLELENKKLTKAEASEAEGGILLLPEVIGSRSEQLEMRNEE